MLDLDAVAGDDEREGGDGLRLGEAAADAPARAAAEGQERVARVLAQEAFRLERVRVFPVFRCCARGRQGAIVVTDGQCAEG